MMQRSKQWCSEKQTLRLLIFWFFLFPDSQLPVLNSRVDASKSGFVKLVDREPPIDICLFIMQHVAARRQQKAKAKAHALR